MHTAVYAPLTVDRILASPELDRCIRRQARSLLMAHEASPRTASPFATQQRWLMSHAALALYLRNEIVAPGSGLLGERFIEKVVGLGLASRNTASAFLKEMLKYGIVRHVAGSEGKRYRPFEPAPATLAAFANWLALHLTTLDGLDGGNRAASFVATPDFLGAVQPRVADGLLASRVVREPDGTFSLFTWVDDGGLVMDRLIAGCAEGSAGLPRIPTAIRSISSLAKGLNLSRTQLSRKVAVAEAMGSLGWSGVRGKSSLWLSAAFQREYHAAQAIKLAIIDAAFVACRLAA
ncbi:MAG: hypothetical protein GC182_16730 [Rhodopseudomonas sp.]|nr:hypothetical protein [Rhodopseudomonas sp.]